MKVPWGIAQLPISANAHLTDWPTGNHAIFGHTTFSHIYTQ